MPDADRAQRVDQVEQPAGDAALVGRRGGEERHGRHGIGGARWLPRRPDRGAR